MLFNTKAFKQIKTKDVNALSDFYQNIDMTKITSDAYILNGMTYLESSYTIQDGYLFIINKSNELMSIPFNENGEFIDVNSLYEFMVEMNIKSIICVPEFNELLTKSESKKLFSIKELKAFGFEHIYDNFKLYEMAGKEYKNFRNKVHKFSNRYSNDIEIIPYSNELTSLALHGYEIWLETLGKKIMDSGTEIWDRTFFVKCLKEYSRLNIDFWLVIDKTKDECIGCVAYTIINDNLAYGLFRKLSPDYNYIAQYMQWYQAKMLAEQGVQYLNDAYDSEKVGLRDLKTGFKPVYSMKLYSMSLRKQKGGK